MAPAVSKTKSGYQHYSEKETAAAQSTGGLKMFGPSDQTKLVFRRYGDRYFLSQVWVAGQELGHQLFKGSREIEVALDYAPQEVVVMAELR